MRVVLLFKNNGNRPGLFNCIGDLIFVTMLKKMQFPHYGRGTGDMYQWMGNVKPKTGYY